MVDSAFDRPEDAVNESDAVVFCVPVLAIPDLAGICKAHFSGDCIVTDVGSTKAELMSELVAVFLDISATFVGSHPLAGSEKNGLEAARGDLYEGATVIVTPPIRDMEQDRSAVARVKELWEGIGARVSVMGPEEHDRIIARTSHLPHLVASALVNSVCRKQGEKVVEFCGAGFGDTTRIASGSEDIWHDIVKSNRLSVRRELSEFIKIFNRVRVMIEQGDFEGVRQFLAEAREKRRALDVKQRSRDH